MNGTQKNFKQRPRGRRGETPSSGVDQEKFVKASAKLVDPQLLATIEFVRRLTSQDSLSDEQNPSTQPTATCHA
jgi:hypothetical protein